jgi:hypothetical protein
LKHLSRQLQQIILEYYTPLNRIGEAEFAEKKNPSKWSKIEILGHLVDSAQNNIRRFVVSQYEDVPKIIYKQDDWVKIANYQHYPTSDLIELWSLLNKHICIILDKAPALCANKMSRTNDPELRNIEWLAGDYIKHLMHHLHQILSMAPIGYP